jgi:hypothetical protein
MNTQVVAERNESVRVRPYFPVLAEIGRRAGKTLRSFGHAFMHSMEKTRSAQAARFLNEHPHLFDNYK